MAETTKTQYNTMKWIKEKFKSEHPLSKDEEDLLFNLAKKGNKTAKTKLLKANMKFVIQVASSYHNESLTQEELINEGAIGLWKAMDYYDPSRGVRFITYAVWWIKASITRAISEKGSMVRLPLNQQTLLHKARAKSGDQQLPAEIKALEAISGKTISLSATFDNESGIKLEDIIADKNADNPEESTEKYFIRKFANKLLNKLPARERQIVKDLNGVDRDCTRSIREESLFLGLSRERIRQLRDQARLRLRRTNSDGHLNPTLMEIMS